MRVRGEKAEGVLKRVPAVQLIWLGEQCFNRKCVKLTFFEGSEVRSVVRNVFVDVASACGSQRIIT